MNKRNAELDLLRLLYSLMIVAFHFYRPTGEHWGGGNIAVEFYFIVAGTMLFLSWERQEEKGEVFSPVEYFIHRFKRLFPWNLTAYAAAAVLFYGLIKTEGSFYEDFWEILMLGLTGLNQNRFLLNRVAWTNSAMLIAGFVIWTLLCSCKDKFPRFILPIFLLFAAGLTRQNAGSNYPEWVVFTTAGTIRALIYMCVGHWCVELSKILNSMRFTTAGRVALTVADLSCHGIIVAVAMQEGTLISRMFSAALIVPAVSIALSERSFVPSFLNRTLCRSLADMSLSIFLIHWVILSGFEWRLGSPDYYSALPQYVLAVAVAATAHHYITKGLIAGTDLFCRWSSSVLLAAPPKQQSGGVYES